MSFPRYPKYKPSGVEWLGEVPAHWEVMRVKHLAHSIEQGWSPQCEGFPVETENEWGVLKVGCVNGGTFNPSENKALPPDLDPIPSLGISARDLLISRANTRELVGSAALAAKDYPRLLLCDKLYRLRLKPELGCPNFLAFYLGASTARGSIELGATGASSSMVNIGQSVILELELAVPPLEEQQSIAVALESETLKIDALIAEHQLLIGLLKEKRQAVISEAVIKGMNPSAPMKPSGIEWLDDMPSHWQTLALKHLAKTGVKTFTDGDWIEAPYITSEGVRLIQTGNIGIGIYKEQGFRYISQETFEQLSCTEVKPGDVLICRLDGPVGRACLAPDLGVRMITSVDNAILKVDADIAPEYVVSLLSSVPWISWIDALCRVGGGFRLRVSRSQLGELRLPVPPYEEQRSIARYLAVETAKWDALTTEAQRAIDLLQERRTALISAAVTGQIDVRAFAERQTA